VPWVTRMQQLVHEHVGQTPQQRTSRWREELEAGGLFTPFAEREIAHVVHGDLEALLARVASVSYISALAEVDRRRVLDAVAAAVQADPQTRGRGQLAMAYVTHVTWCRRRGT
jgi:hypothetical protein